MTEHRSCGLLLRSNTVKDEDRSGVPSEASSVSFSQPWKQLNLSHATGEACSTIKGQLNHKTESHNRCFRMDRKSVIRMEAKPAVNDLPANREELLRFQDPVHTNFGPEALIKMLHCRSESNAVEVRRYSSERYPLFLSSPSRGESKRTQMLVPICSDGTSIATDISPSMVSTEVSNLERLENYTPD